MAEFKVDDKEVVKNNHGSIFKNGDIVVITEITIHDNYRAVNDNGEKGFLYKSQVQALQTFNTDIQIGDVKESPFSPDTDAHLKSKRDDIFRHMFRR